MFHNVDGLAHVSFLSSICRHSIIAFAPRRSRIALVRWNVVDRRSRSRSRCRAAAFPISQLRTQILRATVPLKYTVRTLGCRMTLQPNSVASGRQPFFPQVRRESVRCWKGCCAVDPVTPHDLAPASTFPVERSDWGEGMISWRTLDSGLMEMCWCGREIRHLFGSEWWQHGPMRQSQAGARAEENKIW